MAKAQAKEAPKDALDLLAEGDPRSIIALMLWKDRHRNPDMAVQITEKDIAGFDACCAYLEVTPEVRIVRPQGRPAQAAIPAQGPRRAVPGRAAESPRPFVAVNVVRKGTQDGIKPIENNEDDARLRDRANELRRFRDNAPTLAAQMLKDAASGQFSTSTIQEAAQALTALARA